MSFSYDVKAELSKVSNLSNKKCVKYELIGYLLTNNINIDEKNIRFSTENQFNINRFSRILSNLDITNFSIEIKGKNFIITCKKKNVEKILDDFFSNKLDIPQDENLKKCIIRGAFLGGGSVNNPEKKYHAEIIIKGENGQRFINSILKQYGINFKVFLNQKYYLYTKDGQTISDFLAFIGANNSVLRFEEIRVMRDIRNNVNRVVNCETANLNKIINASLKQIEDINYIKKMQRFDTLPDNLKEIANIRIKNPEASLVELGNMLKKPVSKSGVNHRLKSLSIIADEIRNLENEGTDN